MLRPEQMSKVSVAGTKSVVRDVIDVAHEQNLLHLTDYQGEYEGFDTGSPLGGAEEAADKLVTARSLISILGVTEEDAGPSRIVTEEALEDEFEEVRQEVNELDDRRDELESELQSIEERIAALEPFVDLGIDLDLLSGYDALEVAVGQGDADAIEDALESAEGVEAFDVRTGGDTVAVFVYPSGETDGTLDEALVGVEFTRFDVPDAEGSPEEYVQELEQERETLQSKLEAVENDLETLRLEHGGFLLAVEEELDVEVQKAEAPLSFATTEHAFFAEGWIPTKDYEQFRSALVNRIGDRIEVEEVERAEYDLEERESVSPGLTQGSTDGEVVTDGGAGTDADGSRASSELRSDGGHADEKEIDHPPVVQDNPGPVKPFEMLVRTINRPSYYDLDPTIVLFLTFPIFYGFMIGDIGYGLLYTGLGYWIYSSFESDAIASLGGVGVIAGLTTIVFGLLYAEAFGFHLPYTPVMHKGLQPAEVEWAQLWLVLSLAAALVHLTAGYAFDFVKQLSHGVKDAVLESGSWVVLMFGVWMWVFSRHAAGGKPELLFKVLDGHPIALGFNGFPVAVGYVGLALLVVGFVLLVAGEGFIGAVESLNVLTHVLSYTRLAAVMLAKGGMAFVVNLLFFGAYTYHGEFHFMTGTTAEQVLHHHPEATIMFGGLVHGGVAAILGGLLILVIGHVLVLALGITSAGLQAIRLEYVEFFGKFYEGGGKKYEPFGHDRSYTTQD
ncbi:V-type ATP synthase subunit I [Halospeciosus flavus]|uniref:A-type ATP synthase subunit I n=1 Tax=Halospeciosus flavus TaxID=3032283 RepID=A0ABD5Z7J9_9EURY|nr:V-type ATP synthase subunit I [Halospeciosus flavus]